MIYLKCIVFNYKIYYDMYIYVLFNILDTFIYYILLFIFIILIFTEL